MGKFIFTSLLCFYTFFSSTTHAIGGHVGNGGDTVFCSASTVSPLNGYYNLDFVIGQANNPTNLIVPILNLDSSLQRILHLLAKHSPELTHSLSQFIMYTKNTDDYSRPQLWSPAHYGLVSISDEQMIKLIPSNCLSQNTPQIIQTVIRRYEGAVLKYYYDVNIFSKLPDLQLSFLYIHEWLWSFTNDPEVIRNVNLFLHSQSSVSLGSGQFMSTINGLGISFNNSPPKPLCAMDPSIKLFVESKMQKSCIQFKEWDSVNKIEIKNAHISTLPYNELNLFPKLAFIELTGNQISYLFPNTFQGVSSLAQIGLKQNQISDLSPLLLKELYSLNFLDLSNNKIEALQANSFYDQKSVRILLDSNKIETLDLGSLNVNSFFQHGSKIEIKITTNKLTTVTAKAIQKENLRFYYDIDLRNNPITEIDILDFVNELKAANGSIKISFFHDIKLIKSLMNQSMVCWTNSSLNLTECTGK